jgi:DedD protein
MAFFKFRKTGDEPNSPAALSGPGAPAESAEAMRKRATFRLIGAAVLVLAGVIGFPMLFDSQPRPVPVDIAIEIPDKAKVPPLAMPAPAPAIAVAAPAVASGIVTEPPAAPVADNAGSKKPQPITESAQSATKKEAAESTKVEPKPEARLDAKSEPKASPKVAAPEPAKPAAKADDGAKALALLEGQAADKQAAAATDVASAGSRYVVQVGAFADATRARDARSKLEAAGLKTYTQVVDTKDGKRTRVRVGPFADKAGAESAAAKVKALDLSASVLTL